MMLLLFVSFMGAAALAAECPPLEDSRFYFLPHETDCSKFYICANGDLVLQSCPNGTHFSPMHMVCQYPVLAGCDSTLPDLCPDWSLILRPSPDSCSKFYVCQHGNVHVFDCPEGLEFNAELQQCVWPQDSDCAQGDQAADEQVSVQDGEQVDEQVSEQVDEQVSEQVDAQVSEQDDDQGCEDGALSANVDCTKYTVCSHGVLLAADCPAGLHWNSELAVCDWPASAGCEQ